MILLTLLLIVMFVFAADIIRVAIMLLIAMLYAICAIPMFVVRSVMHIAVKGKLG